MITQLFYTDDEGLTWQEVELDSFPDKKTKAQVLASITKEPGRITVTNRFDVLGEPPNVSTERRIRVEWFRLDEKGIVNSTRFCNSIAYNYANGVQTHFAVHLNAWARTLIEEVKMVKILHNMTCDLAIHGGVMFNEDRTVAFTLHMGPTDIKPKKLPSGVGSGMS